MDKKLLVVDDEESIVTLLKYNLEQAGYTVETAYDGEQALESAVENEYDLIILDLMLPQMDGMDVLKSLRQQKKETPVLMLTAKDDEFDKVLGLELGADDYMTKPFSPREVTARVKAILRRIHPVGENAGGAGSQRKSEEEIKIGSLRVLPEFYEAYVQDEELELTPKEFELLVYLARNLGRVLSRDQLLSSVWNYDFAGDTRIVDVHISHLREKIEPNSRKPVFIKTIRGLGYKMEEPKENE